MKELVDYHEISGGTGEPEFDYQILLNALKGYADPQRRRQDLLKKGVIVRVKKGLYVWHDKYSKAPYSREILANLIYGPSYISLEYALAHWRLIPERVMTVTSVTSKKDKVFRTPVGDFTYRYLNKSAYTGGICQIEIKKGRYALMASAEKALLDYIALKGDHFDDFADLLFADLRIAKQDWRELSMRLLLIHGRSYRHHAIQSFCQYLKKEWI